MVQQASFLIPSLGEDSKANRAGRAPAAMTTWVCRSSPVTMLPTDRRAGVWTEVELCLFAKNGVEQRRRLMCVREPATYIKRSTNRLQTPLSITAWILSLVPSERYDRAQQASIRTSSSRE